MLLIPIDDNLLHGGRSLATRWLIAINVAVFLLVSLPLSFRAADPKDPLWEDYIAMSRFALEEATGYELDFDYWFEPDTAEDLFTLRWGYRPSSASLVTVLTSMFLHGTTFHLLGNMLFLWVFGRAIEGVLGRRGYVGAYLGTGFAGVVAHTAMQFSSPIPAIGASAAISGIMGFHFVYFRDSRIRFLIPFPLPRWGRARSFFRTFTVRARSFLVINALIFNVLPMALGLRGVSYSGHLGGFGLGLVAAALLKQRPGYRKSRQPQVRTEADKPGLEEAAEIQRLVGIERFEEAARTYLTLDAIQASAVSPRVALDLAQGMVRAGRRSSARKILNDLIGRHRNDPVAGEVRSLLASLGEK